jgi:MoxR-like ATPase
LPEAQLDRFMFKILVDYPSEQEEMKIIDLLSQPDEPVLNRVLSAGDIMALQDIVRQVPCAEHVMRYAMSLARSTRPQLGTCPQFIRDYVSWGAGPRASQYLVLSAKARALLEGRYFVSIEDIQSVAHPVLRHRIVTNFTAEADGVSGDQIVDRLLQELPEAPTPDLDRLGTDRVLSS